MESAVILVLALKMAVASSMGVMFGWQPMPDSASNEDGPKIEYIVQIEPELAATLRDGLSIPITSDIPDDIGPIGRIRIVVGRDELPRQKLVTNFKPWPAKQTREGIVETQHTVPPVQSSGSGRYGALAAANNAILPSGGNPPNSGAATTANPFNRAFQPGDQQARNLAAEVKQPILPPAEQLFEQGRANSRGLQNAFDDRANGLKRDVQQAAERAGQGLRQTAGNLGQSAREAANEFGRSLLPQQSNLNNGQDLPTKTILPPKSPPAGLASGKGRQFDQPSQTPSQRPPLGAPPVNFAGSSPDRTNSTRTNSNSQPGSAWSAITNNPPATTRAGNLPPDRYSLTNQLPATDSQWPRGQNDRDAYGLANLPSKNTTPNYDGNQQPGFNTASSGTSGPKFPVSATHSTPQQLNSQQDGDTHWSNQSPRQPSTPEITKHMLEETASNKQGFQQQKFGGQAFNTQGPETTPSNSEWNQNGFNTADNNNSPSKSDPVFPLLLSWVLLTGSGVGNAYLWLSYLDVRNKYRGVVHGSPGRRDRYDD